MPTTPVDDRLWAIIEPLLPPPPKRRKRYAGRKRKDYRGALNGILFVLKTGIQWEDLPQELGWGCGMTCWRRLRDWQRAGAWKRLHHVLLEHLHQADRIDWERIAVDSSHVRSVGAGGKKRPKSRRSQPSREQAPRRHRRQWDSVGRSPHAGEHSGRQRAVRARGRDPCSSRQAWKTAVQAEVRVRGSRLRLRSPSRRPSAPGDPPLHRAQEHGTWERTGRLPLGG
jgi:transposase